MHCASYPPSFDHIINIWKDVEIINSLRNRPHVPYSLRSQYISNNALSLEQQEKFHTYRK